METEPERRRRTRGRQAEEDAGGEGEREEEGVMRKRAAGGGKNVEQGRKNRCLVTASPLLAISFRFDYSEPRSASYSYYSSWRDPA